MNIGAIRILGVDPGLRNTGWGMIEVAGARLSYVDCGSIHTDAASRSPSGWRPSSAR